MKSKIEKNKSLEMLSDIVREIIQLVYMIVIILLAGRGLIHYGVGLHVLGIITIKESIFIGVGIISLLIVLRIMNVFTVTVNAILMLLIIPQILFL